MAQTLLYIKENTTVGELKKFLAQIPDESKIYLDSSLDNTIRLDNYQTSDDKYELYIELV